MKIAVKRVYDPPAKSDGQRVLVDRIWPRGLSRDKASIDCWLKDIAPSTALRKWFGHDPAKWPEFRRRYFKELDGRAEAIAELKQFVRKGKVTLLFGAKETRCNNAMALKAYLER